MNVLRMDMMIETGCESCDSCEADLSQSLFALARTNFGRYVVFVFGLPVPFGRVEKRVSGTSDRH